MSIMSPGMNEVLSYFCPQLRPQITTSSITNPSQSTPTALPPTTSTFTAVETVSAVTMETVTAAMETVSDVMETVSAAAVETVGSQAEDSGESEVKGEDTGEGAGSD